MSNLTVYRLLLGFSLLANVLLGRQSKETEASTSLGAAGLKRPHAAQHLLGSTPGVADVQMLEETLASRKYPAAVELLKRMGASESLIQDIVLGAINRSYAGRVVAWRRSPWRFWDPVQRRCAEDTEMGLERERQARALEAERNRLVQQLLGLDWPTIESEVTGRPDPFEKYTDNLPAPIRGRARQLLATYDELERDVIRGAGGTIGLPERAELNRLYSEKIVQLKQFLSPQNIEEYQMRTSPTAEHLKQVDLVGFAPTEEEFRAIFRARKAFDERSSDLSLDLAQLDNRGPLWQAQDELEEQLRQGLGDQRYADYRRSQDYTFRGLIELTDEFELPNAAAAQVHGIREAVLERIREATASQPSSQPQRRASLQQIRIDAENGVRSVLGEAAYRKYTQLQVGGWIAEIEQQ